MKMFTRRITQTPNHLLPFHVFTPNGSQSSVMIIPCPLDIQPLPSFPKPTQVSDLFFYYLLSTM